MQPTYNVSTAPSPRHVSAPPVPLLWSIIGLVLLTVGCKGDVLPTALATHTETLTPAEKTLVVGDVEFYFPSGTFDEETEVTLSVAAPVPLALPDGRAGAMNVVEISPHDLTFLQPIQIRSPAPALTQADLAAYLAEPGEESILAHHLANDDAREWMDIEAEFKAGSVRFKSTTAGRFTASTKVAKCIVDVSPPSCEIPDDRNFDCNNVREGCADGEVISVDEAGCTLCVPAPTTPQSCDEVRAELDTFLDRTISLTCSNFCTGSDECNAFRFESACGDGCYSLYGLIDEEPIMAYMAFAQERCGVCGANTVRIHHVGGGVCVDGQCQFPDALANAEGEVWYDSSAPREY